MPSQTASSKKPKPSIAELQETINTLQKENKALQSKNAKLKKDCTNFAKRLKQIEDLAFWTWTLPPFKRKTTNSSTR